MTSLVVLAACNSDGTDTRYADLKSGLWITFLENPAAAEGTCNPLIEAAYRGDDSPHELKLEMRASYYKPTLKTVNKTSRPQTRIEFAPSTSADLKIGRAQMYDTKPFEGTCKEMSLHLIRLSCLDQDGGIADRCPHSSRTGGFQWFGFVKASF